MGTHSMVVSVTRTDSYLCSWSGRLTYAPKGSICIPRVKSKSTLLTREDYSPLVTSGFGAIEPMDLEYVPARRCPMRILPVTEYTPDHLPGFQIVDRILHYVGTDGMSSPMVFAGTDIRVEVLN